MSEIWGKMRESGPIRALTLAVALHGVGGALMERTSEQTKIEYKIDEREKVKDTIFLPANKEELVRHLLNQAQCLDIEQLKREPERLKQIDIGAYFLQIEFLERKITAEEAKTAFLNMQLKRRVFTEMAETIDNPLIIAQEIVNEIAGPQVGITQEATAHSIDEYRAGKARVSSYFNHGISNCYASDRAFVSIFGSVYPDIAIGINHLAGHVRPLIYHNKNIFIAEIGHQIYPATKNDLAGSVVFPEYRQRYLDLLNISSEAIKMPPPNQKTGTTDWIAQLGGMIQSGISHVGREYDNTELGNFHRSDDPLPDYSGISGTPPPEIANRPRAIYDPTELNALAGDTESQEVDSQTIDIEVQRKLITHEQKGKMIEEERAKIAQKADTKTEDPQTRDAKPAESLDTQKETPQEAKKSPDYYERISKLNVAEIQIPRLVGSYIHIQKETGKIPDLNHPKYKEFIFISDKIFDEIQQLDAAGLLDEFVKRHNTYIINQYNKKIPHESAYAQSQIIIRRFIETHKKLKKDLREEILPHIKGVVEMGFQSSGRLALSAGIPEELYDKLEAEYTIKIHPEDLTIPEDQVLDFFKQRIIPMLEKRQVIHANDAGIEIYLSQYPTLVSKVLELFKDYPIAKIVVEGAVDFSYLRDKTEEETGGMLVEWRNPPEKFNASDLTEMYGRNKVVILDIEGNSLSNTKLSYINERTHSIETAYFARLSQDDYRPIRNMDIARMAYYFDDIDFSDKGLAKQYKPHVGYSYTYEDMHEIALYIIAWGLHDIEIITLNSRVDELSWLADWKNLGLLNKLKIIEVEEANTGIPLNPLIDMFPQLEELRLGNGHILIEKPISNKNVLLTLTGKTTFGTEVDKLLTHEFFNIELNSENLDRIIPSISHILSKKEFNVILDVFMDHNPTPPTQGVTFYITDTNNPQKNIERSIWTSMPIVDVAKALAKHGIRGLTQGNATGPFSNDTYFNIFKQQGVMSP